MQTKVRIRPATADDLRALTEIYNHYVLHTPVTFDVEPFAPEERRAWLDQFDTTGRHRLFVAEEQGTVLGYAGSMRFRPKPAYDVSVEVTIYLREQAQGRGLGGRLYTTLFAALEGEDLHRAYAGVTLPNPASLALHERFGFRPIGEFGEVGRKLGRYWDVLWLQKSCGPRNGSGTEPAT